MHKRWKQGQVTTWNKKCCLIMGCVYCAEKAGPCLYKASLCYLLEGCGGWESFLRTGGDQRSLLPSEMDRLKNWPDRNLKNFREGKFKVLPLAKNDPWHQYMLEPVDCYAALQTRTFGS